MFNNVRVQPHTIMNWFKITLKQYHVGIFLWLQHGFFQWDATKHLVYILNDKVKWELMNIEIGTLNKVL
jgi:hypothetical protein